MAKVFSAYTVFLVLLGLYFIKKLFWLMRKIKMNPDKMIDRIDRLMDKIDGKKVGEVSRIYLIELAMKNLRSKKMRAVVTIGGMAIGVGAVVFLVSLGYGLEKLVISRVARLDELKIIDVGMGEVSASKMNDEVVEKIRSIEGVKEVIPAVSMVAKVKYKNSIVDMMSIGVDERYIEAVGARVVTGVGLKTAPEDIKLGQRQGEGGKIAGWQQEVVEVSRGEKVSSGLISFNLNPESLVPLWQECNRDSEMLGYIVRQEGGYIGEKVWGERYYIGDDRGVIGRKKGGTEEYSKWVKTKAPLWKKVEDGVVVAKWGSNSRQEWGIGCITESEILEEKKISGYNSLDSYLSGKSEKIVDGRVLGVTATASASMAASESAVAEEMFETIVATDSAGVEWVELKKTGEAVSGQKELTYSGTPQSEAFISLGMLRIFGLSKEKVIGETFGVSFIIPDGLVPEVSGRLQSEQADFKVAGVIDDESSNYFYFHLADAKKLGVANYSQLKVISNDQSGVDQIRKEIETSGLKTASTLDTVAEIEKLFRTLRFALGLLGTIALAVAALGMFNTMTVSLLERTREVGVMKAMGMLSDDVRELFLAESMIMGVGGGLFGVLVGIVGGKLVSLFLTSVSVIKGQGAMDISYVPIFFVAFILLVSFMVGIITGWYPSRRARQISALNALRYE